MPDGISASPQPLAQPAASGVSSFITGAACASVAVAIWAGWLVVMRLGVTTTISVPDLAALRFAAAGLLLLPVVLRSVSLSIVWALPGSSSWFSAVACLTC